MSSLVVLTELNKGGVFSMPQVIELNSLGRLLSYDPRSKTVTVLLDSLYMPNGIALSPDEDFLLLAETSIGRILRYRLVFNTFLNSILQ